MNPLAEILSSQPKNFDSKGVPPMKNEHTSSTAPLLLGMAAGAALGAAGVMATNTSQRQMRRTARKIAKGAEHAVSQLDKMVGDFVERKMEG